MKPVEKRPPVSLTPTFPVYSAVFCDVLGNPLPGSIEVRENTVSFQMAPPIRRQL